MNIEWVKQAQQEMSLKWGAACLVLLMVLLLPVEGFAALDIAKFALMGDYTCDAKTGVYAGSIYDHGMGECVLDMEHIFSGFICEFEDIVGEIFSGLYCGLVSNMYTAVLAILTLFTIIFGVLMLIGQSPLTAREAAIFVIKFGLVFAFATNADFAVEYILRGTLGFLQESIVIVLEHVHAGGSAGLTLSGGGNSLLNTMDQLIYGFFEASDQGECKGGSMAMMLLFAMSVPPVALIGIMMMFKMAMTLTRAILGYLFSLTGLMFLLTLTPLFFGFMLFKSTQSFFNQWLKYFMSFSLQMMVVFAFIGFVISLEIGDDFRELFSLSAPYDQTKWNDNVRVGFKDVCTFCNDATVSDGTAQCGTNAKGLDVFEMIQDPEYLNWLGTRMGYLFIMAYLLEAILVAGAQVAKILSGAEMHAPTLGGHPHDGAGAMHLTGRGAVSSGVRNFGAAFNSTRGGVPGKVAAGAKAAGQTVKRSVIPDN